MLLYLEILLNLMVKEILAIVATATIVLSYIPQLIKGYRTKSLQDISWGFLGLLLLGLFAWTFYAILNEDMVFLIANTTILIFGFSLVLMKFHYDKK